MPEDNVKISFVKKATVTLAENERVARWDDLSGGSLSLQSEKIVLRGTWRVSKIGSILGAGPLQFILIRPFFQRPRAEEIPLHQINRVVVGPYKQGFTEELAGAPSSRNKRVYHLVQSAEASMFEVHTFTTDTEPRLEELLRRVVLVERLSLRLEDRSSAQAPHTTGKPTDAGAILESRCSNCGRKIAPSSFEKYQGLCAACKVADYRRHRDAGASSGESEV